MVLASCSSHILLSTWKGGRGRDGSRLSHSPGALRAGPALYAATAGRFPCFKSRGGCNCSQRELLDSQGDLESSCSLLLPLPPATSPAAGQSYCPCCPFVPKEKEKQRTGHLWASGAESIPKLCSCLPTLDYSSGSPPPPHLLLSSGRLELELLGPTLHFGPTSSSLAATKWPRWLQSKAEQRTEPRCSGAPSAPLTQSSYHRSIHRESLAEALFPSGQMDRMGKAQG